MAKLAEEQTPEKVELSVADDVMDFVRSIPFDTG